MTQTQFEKLVESLKEPGTYGTYSLQNLIESGVSVRAGFITGNRAGKKGYIDRIWHSKIHVVMDGTLNVVESAYQNVELLDSSDEPIIVKIVDALYQPIEVGGMVVYGHGGSIYLGRVKKITPSGNLSVGNLMKDGSPLGGFRIVEPLRCIALPVSDTALVAGVMSGFKPMGG
jgi:hypothetical protein